LRCRRHVGLVEHQQLGHVTGADLMEDPVHGGDLAQRVGCRRVDDVQGQVTAVHLLQG